VPLTGGLLSSHSHSLNKYLTLVHARVIVLETRDIAMTKPLLSGGIQAICKDGEVWRVMGWGRPGH
jgi:hypothetical protein